MCTNLFMCLLRTVKCNVKVRVRGPYRVDADGSTLSSAVGVWGMAKRNTSHSQRRGCVACFSFPRKPEYPTVASGQSICCCFFQKRLRKRRRTCFSVGFHQNGMLTKTSRLWTYRSMYDTRSWSQSYVPLTHPLLLVYRRKSPSVTRSNPAPGRRC